MTAVHDARPLARLYASYRAGTLTRRSFMQQAVAAGMTLPVALHAVQSVAAQTPIASAPDRWHRRPNARRGRHAPHPPVAGADDAEHASGGKLQGSTRPSSGHRAIDPLPPGRHARAPPGHGGALAGERAAGRRSPRSPTPCTEAFSGATASRSPRRCRVHLGVGDRPGTPPLLVYDAIANVEAIDDLTVKSPSRSRSRLVRLLRAEWRSSCRSTSWRESGGAVSTSRSSRSAPARTSSSRSRRATRSSTDQRELPRAEQAVLRNGQPEGWRRRGFGRPRRAPDRRLRLRLEPPGGAADPGRSRRGRQRHPGRRSRGTALERLRSTSPTRTTKSMASGPRRTRRTRS